MSNKERDRNQPEALSSTEDGHSGNQHYPSPRMDAGEHYPSPRMDALVHALPFLREVFVFDQ
jgi:hypothetical protein